MATYTLNKNISRLSPCKEYITEKEQRDRRNKIIKQARIRDADLRVVERMKGRE